MKPISFKRHRFPADAIHQPVWLYFRFSLSPELPHHPAAIYNTFSIQRHLINRPILRRLRVDATSAWTAAVA